MEKRSIKKKHRFLNGIKNEIESINDRKKFEYGEEFMKIKFDTDDNLPLNKQLNFPTTTVVVTFVFEEDGKFCPQVLLDECLYEL